MNTPKKPHHTVVPAKHQELTPEGQKLLRSYPLHTEAEMKSYLHPAEGLERVWPACMSILHNNPAIAQALDIDVAKVQREMDETSALDGPTQAAYALYRRGLENLVAKRSDIVRAVYRVNRFVQNAENPELVREFEKVSDWVSETHAHNTQGASASADAPPAAASASSAARTS